MKNIATILEAAGSDFSKIAKLNVYLKSCSDFLPMNEAYITHFGKVKPVSGSCHFLLEGGFLTTRTGKNLRCGIGPAIEAIVKMECTALA